MILGGAGDDQLTGENSGDALGDDLGTVTPGEDFLDGGDGNDSIQGEHLGDVLYGGAGNDELWGDARYTLPIAYHGDDFLDGEEGDDELVGQGGADTLLGGAGDDLLFGDDDTIVASAHGDDFLDGGEGADVLRGYGGDDTLLGGAGDDELLAEAGADFLDGGQGADSLDAGEGDDELWGGSEDDELLGGEGADFLDGETGDDTLAGGAGEDDLFGAAGLDSLVGGDGADRLFGEAGDDVLSAEAGDDRLDGGTGKDELIGGEGDDTFLLSLGDGEDVVVDSLGANAIEFGPGIAAGDLEVEQYQGADGAGYLRIAYGLPGDVVTINSGLLGAIRRFRFADGTVLNLADLLGEEDLPAEIFGSARDEVLVGDHDANLLDAGAGDDELLGGAGDDVLRGGIGADTLEGGAGADSLDGGPGADTLRGGAGEDLYRVGWGSGEDRIVEADAGLNVLALDPGLRFEDLSGQRIGDDLVLAIRGAADRATIAGFYAATGEWRLDAATGESKALASFLAEDAGRTAAAASAAEAIAEYRAQVRSLVYAALGAEGYTVLAEGTLAKVDTLIRPYSIDTTASSARFVLAPPSAGEGSVERASLTYESTSQTTYSQRETELVRIAPGTRANNPSSVSYWPAISTRLVPLPGASTFGVFGQPPAGSNKAGQPEFLGTWMPLQETTWVPLGSPVPGQPQGRVTVTDSHTTREETIRVEDVSGGAGADMLRTAGFSVADGGAGDDALGFAWLGGLPWRTGLEDYTFTFTLRPFDPRNLGSLRYGNLGEDLVFGSGQDDVLLGGDGADILDGGPGADTYRVFLDETGIDLIADSGFVIIDSESGWSRYKQYLFGGAEVFAAAYEYAQTHDIRTRPNDLAAVQTLAGAHVLERDTVQFGAGISLADLTISWGEYVPQGETAFPDDFATTHATLDLSWRPDAGVRVLIPHSVREGTFDPFRDVEYGLGAGIESFRFADGTRLSMVEMAARAGPTPNLDPHLADNVFVGTDRDESFSGSAGDDRADGGGGADTLYGGEGDDVLAGGPGDDPDLWAGNGNDRYRFARGDGHDTIDNYDAFAASSTDAVEFGAGIAPGEVTVSRAGANLALAIGASGDGLTIRGFFAEDERYRAASEIDEFRFDSGVVWSAAFVRALAEGGPQNRAPVLATPLADQDAPEDAAWGLSGAGAFIDPDALDVLSFAATLAGGAALPGWLGFDGSTGAFSGTPAQADVGAYEIVLTARDGGGLGATDSFVLTVTNVNDAPVVANPIGNLSADEDAPFVFVVPAATFADEDVGDFLSLSATLSSGLPLPAWLAFNAAAGQFSGTPGNADTGTARIRLVASDAAGAEAATEFDLTVVNVNDPPVLALPLSDQTIQERALFSWTVPANAFADIDPGEVLGYAATLGSGAPLPAWLAFNPATRTLSGTPGEYDIGSVAVRISATDSAGASVADDFNLTVTPKPGQTLTGTSGANTIVGSDGADTIRAGGGADTVYGNEGQDALYGEDGHDKLYGWTGHDVLDGGSGADQLFGDEGDDRLFGGAGNDDLWGWTGADELRGGDNADLLGGDAGEDLLYGEGGNDELYGGADRDTLNGGQNADYLEGNDGADLLQGEAGNDDLLGGAGNDLLDSGANSDVADGGEGSDLITAGTGHDALLTGTGADVLAYNRGDGKDTVRSSGAQAKTVSLGGGITYTDLSLEKSGADLLLNVGGNEKLILDDWYAAPANQGFLTLQVIAEAMAGFDPASADPLRNKKVQTFDFAALVGAFDAARAADPMITRWALMDRLLTAHLAASDTEALGGDLAYQYGKAGTLAGMSTAAAQDVLGSAQFGTQAQALRPLATLQEGPVKLT